MKIIFVLKSFRKNLSTNNSGNKIERDALLEMFIEKITSLDSKECLEIVEGLRSSEEKFVDLNGFEYILEYQKHWHRHSWLLQNEILRGHVCEFLQ